MATGRIIDDCVIDDTPDAILFRDLPFEMDIRVELELRGALKLYEREGADVVEVFSQPRIAQEAGTRTHGGTKLQPGWSLDLTRDDPKTGKPWDLSRPEVQSRVKKLIRQSKPLFVIGSPPCTAFSSIQSLNKGKRPKEVVERELRDAEAHMKFCIELYEMQVQAHRYFLHEHPAGASSWKMKEMVALMMAGEVDAVTFDMCRFGMVAARNGEEGPVRKRTTAVSNSWEVLKRLDKKCPNSGGEGPKHEHVVLEGGRTKQAQVYPRKFCRAVCEGIAAEKRLRLLGMEAMEVLSVESMKEIAKSAGVSGEYGEDPSRELH